MEIFRLALLGVIVSMYAGAAAADGAEFAEFNGVQYSLEIVSPGEGASGIGVTNRQTDEFAAESVRPGDFAWVNGLPLYVLSVRFNRVELVVPRQAFTFKDAKPVFYDLYDVEIPGSKATLRMDGERLTGLGAAGVRGLPTDASIDPPLETNAIPQTIQWGDSGTWHVRNAFLPPGESDRWEVSLLRGAEYVLTGEGLAEKGDPGGAFANLRETEQTIYDLLTAIQTAKDTGSESAPLADVILEVVRDSGVIEIVQQLKEDFWNRFFENAGIEEREAMNRRIEVWSQLIQSFAGSAMEILRQR